jgi:hypothetical protein
MDMFAPSADALAASGVIAPNHLKVGKSQKARSEQFGRAFRVSGGSVLQAGTGGAGVSGSGVGTVAMT